MKTVFSMTSCLEWVSTVSTSVGWPANLQVKTFRSDTKFETNTMQELERLASFASWPESNSPSPLSLARHGFAYSHESNKVFCPLCRIELVNLTRGDNLAEEHKTRSPECPFVNQVTAGNNSSEPIRLSSSEFSNSLDSAIWDVYTSASRRLQNRQDEAVPNMCLSLSVRVDRLNPDYELLKRESVRLETFHDWPPSAHALPKELAREGFFYTGTIDRVRCAFCRSTLHSWVPGDNPAEEHRIHYPLCPFVLNRDVGNIGIENDDQRENSNQHLMSLTGFVMTGASEGQAPTELPSASQTPTGLPSLEAFMSTPTARATLEMGFSEERLKEAVEQHLSETGQFFPSAESLVEHLLSLGIRQSYIGSGGAASASCATSAASGSVSLPSPAVTSSADSHLSSATVAPPASSSFAAAPPVATTQSADPSSFGDETGRRTGEERHEDMMSLPHNEGAKKGNGPTKKRRRGPKKEKASASGSSSSQAVPSEPQAVLAETSSGCIAAAANSSAEDIVVDPEEQQLLDENSRLKEARTCKVCMDKEVNTVFLPCGHLICCDNCSPKVRNCPLCRTLIRGTVKTYLS